MKGAEKWRPTRLIDVGPPLEDRGPSLCITAHAQGKELQQYLTLSHCWGSYQPARLLQQNYDSMLASIPLESLPKTFIDAISITKRLGFRYIWIDALCIIQDSPKDWNHEATLMEEVFKNSTCTIAASGAVDGTGGCFVSRDPLQVQPAVVGLVFPSVPWQVGYPSPRHREIRIIADPQQNIRQPTKLFRRGWVLQERLLSRRSLYFGESQLFWECRTLSCSEAFPHGLYEKFDDLTMHRFQNLFSKMGNTGKYALTALEIWGAFVSDYTSYDLTNPQDKMVALSGLAVAVQNEFGKYVCGMWKQLFPYELLWTANQFASQFSSAEEKKKTKPAFRPVQYRAPSWSWASVEGVIHYYHCCDSVKAEQSGSDIFSVRDIKATTTDARGVGQVEAASLRVRARPAMATWRLVDEACRLVQLVEVRDKKGHVLDTLMDSDFVECDSFHELNTWPSEVFCIPVMRTRNYEMGCLILQKNAKGNYERLGVFTTVSSCEDFFMKIPKQDMTLV